MTELRLFTNSRANCPGPPVPILFADAKITALRTFASSATQLICTGARIKPGAMLKITGQFLAGGRESGRITTAVAPGTQCCTGSVSYSTHVAKGSPARRG